MEEIHHDDSRPLALTVTPRSEGREQRRRARAARAPFQEPLMPLTEAASSSLFAIACRTPLPDSDDERQLELGCQFPHQCGHRGRLCADACPNNPVPFVEKKRPTRKVTSAKKANRMLQKCQSKDSNYHTMVGADGRKACKLKRGAVPRAGWRAARRRANAWRQFLKQKEQDGLKGTQAERRSAARNALPARGLKQ